MQTEYGFERFLKLSEEMRNGYIDSLNKPENGWEKKFKTKFKTVPSLFSEIFNSCGGTDSEQEAQELFDFIPGYRLMTPTEILETYENIQKFYNSDNEYDSIIAFLQDFSGNFIALAKSGNNEQIVSLVPEEGVVVMHDTVEAFWKTIVKFYTEKVYYIDEDGYLSSDFDLEGEIGAEINEGVDFWNE
ncbi:MAG: hypothetical protein K2N30_01815 [Clostridia bacterium]|nr:hypothetical protein [Clostridia bacterium]